LRILAGEQQRLTTTTIDHMPVPEHVGGRRILSGSARLERRTILRSIVSPCRHRYCPEFIEMNPARSDTRFDQAAWRTHIPFSRAALFAACCLACAFMVAASQAQHVRAAPSARMAPSRTLVAQRVARLKETGDLFRTIAASALPRDLSPAEQVEERKYAAWLRGWAVRLDALAAKGESIVGTSSGAPGVAGRRARGARANSGGAIGAAADGGGQGDLMKATQDMQETQMSFNMQYLQLQEAMQNENRQFTTISNIMKTKHDTVKNSISNVR
jgi:hypothetical protein